jgi:hypothetical protein
MGAVYKARQKELDRIVALKILPPGFGDAAFAERFAREAKALARLNHPGIVTLYEFGRSNGLFFFLMEFVDGVTLRQVLHGGRISPREALAIVPAICDALQYAHDQGIVHRDIKPENILLDRRGRTKVADFGLARILGTDAPLTPSLSPSDGERVAARPGEGTPVLTDSGKIMGTPQYMAPEQFEHPAAVDHRADIYALGVVFYQMLTGELPGRRLDPPSQKVQIDVRLDEVVLRALEKEPERRYQQVSQVKTAVETILQSAPSDALKGEAGPERGGTPSDAPTASRAGGWPKYVYVGVVSGMAAVLAYLVCTHLLFRSPGPHGGRRDIGPPRQVSATTARIGDIRVGVNYLGTVESSNSVTFAVSEDYCQEVIRMFDARQAMTVDAYDSQGQKFGHGLLTGVNNMIDTSTGTLKCKASLIPEGGNLMVPGLFLNIRLLLGVKHGVTLVPEFAIQNVAFKRDPPGAFVWVIQPDHTVTRRPVRVGYDDGTWFEIQSGLSPGEIVVSGGLNGLQEGQKVHFDAPPPSYQWQFNSNSSAGATNPAPK